MNLAPKDTIRSNEGANAGLKLQKVEEKKTLWILIKTVGLST